MSSFTTAPIFLPTTAERMSHCATLLVLPDGERLAAWMTGTYETAPDQYIALARRPAGSSDWTAPERVVDTPGRADGQPVFLLDHAGVLWLYFVTLTGQGWTTALLMRQRSDDRGRQWSAPEALGMEQGLMFRSRPLDLAAVGQPGQWLLPIYDETTWRSAMLLSADDGATWSRGAWISTPPGNIHACVVPLDGNRLLAFLRTGGAGGSIWRTISADAGRHWETPAQTPLPNPNAGIDLLQLRSGALVLAFNNSRTRRTPLCIALSDDAGESWPHMQALEDAEGEFSYPTLVEGRDGRISGVYTWRRQHIQAIELDEAWLRAGRAWTGAGA